MSAMGLIWIILIVLLVAGGITAAVILIVSNSRKNSGEHYAGGQPAPAPEAGRRPCPHCGRMIKQESSFCSFCGQKVEPIMAPTRSPEPAPAFAPPPMPAYAPAPASEIARDNVDEYCPYCESIVPKGAPFCPACGSAIGRAAGSGGSSMPEPDEPAPWPVPPTAPVVEESETVRPPLDYEDMTRSAAAVRERPAEPTPPERRREPSFETHFKPETEKSADAAASFGLSAPSDDDL